MNRDFARRNVVTRAWLCASGLTLGLTLGLTFAGCGGESSAPSGGDVSENDLRGSLKLQVSAQATPSQAKAGDDVTIALGLTAARTASVDVTLTVTDPRGGTAYTALWPAQAVGTGSPLTLQEVIGIDATDPTGIYTVGLEVARPGSTLPFYSNGNVATFAVGSGGGATDAGTPPPTIGNVTLAWSSPSANANVSGKQAFTLTGTSLVNVEIFQSGKRIATAVSSADLKSATATIDTTTLPNGPITVTAHAWNSKQGDPSFTSEADAGSLTVNVSNGATPPPPPGTGRNFLLGFYTNGSEISSYGSFLGYIPEFTYDSSYQDDHHRVRCGQPITGLSSLGGFPVIASVFTAGFNGNGADYAGSAAGKYDSCYEQTFQSIAAYKDSIYGIRIDVEFWPIPAAKDFTGSFDRIVGIGKKYLPSRVKYIFNPNWDQNLGADFVPATADVIGPDAYNNPQWNGADSTAASKAKFDPGHPGSIAYWTKIAQQLGKTMALPEWGDDYGDGVYIGYVADWAFDKVLVTPGQSNKVVYLGYWDSNDNEDAHLRNGSKTAFQNRFGKAAYTGTYWGTPIPTKPYGNFK